jgi:phage FluMu protein Com
MPKDIRCTCHNKLAEQNDIAIKIMCRKCKNVTEISKHIKTAYNIKKIAEENKNIGLVEKSTEIINILESMVEK